ncbi:ATP synthase subunit delta [compost metagenome]
MDEQEVAGIKRELAKATSREIEMDVAIDPEIIGGLVVSIGDQVIDSSLKGRLQSLARTLA